MRTWVNKYDTVVKLSTLTVLLSCLFIFTGLLLSGITETISLSDSLPYLVLLFATLVISLATSFLSFIIKALSTRDYSLIVDPKPLVGFIAVVILALEIWQIRQPIPYVYHYVLRFCLEIGLIYFVLRVVLECLNIDGFLARFSALAAPTILFIYGLGGFVSQSWISLTDITRDLGIVREVFLILTPILTMSVCLVFKPFRLDKKSFLNSIALRWNFLSKSQALALGFFFLGSLMTIVLAILIKASSDPITNLFSSGALNFSWIGLSFLLLAHLMEFTVTQKQYQIAFNLSANSAKKFILRYFTPRSHWAAAVGYRTSTFIIDHDPLNSLAENLPASLLQIREEEISRNIGTILGRLYLHNYTLGNKIYGAVDTEFSLRPCADVLKLFSCLYLDICPLVERRLSSLISLLPLLDPPFAAIIKPEHINNLIRRNQWLFYFNFNWIDQQVMFTPASLRYAVKLDPLPFHLQQSIISYAEKNNQSIGNYVWLGEDAYVQLLQEAPILGGITEACPIPKSSGTLDETLIFVFKFEQLIPRLQKYFDLDQIRQKLLDFDPRPESINITNLLLIQLQQSRCIDDLEHIIDTLRAYSWSGFKEKDQALQLILILFQHLNSENAKETLKQRELVKVKNKLAEAVKQIGYPSQFLHHAQCEKNELRNLEKLKKAALNPLNFRFHEAWLYMSSMLFNRYSAEEKTSLYYFLEKILKTNSLCKDRFVFGKLISSVCNLLKEMETESLEMKVGLMEKICERTIQLDFDLDICCLLLDKLKYLQDHLKVCPIGTKVQKQLKSYLDSFAKNLDKENTSLYQSVISRWQLFEAGQSGESQKTIKLAS